ncbi:uncharacterized protein VTP21DRAFT_1183 [Calcarisporiella thermophila]|uniref:uncharacterized protein n=1 Tax=Calcarisporiella thermophila TaxID=911321 RepID=UPI0037431345
MFLDHLSGLLQHDPDSNILAILPHSVRRTLVAEITGFLCPSSGPPPSSLLSSPAHVSWFFEIIAQGLNLPLEDMNITSDDVTIYSTWLLDAQSRPLAVQKQAGTEGEQIFLRTIFRHLSLLFQPRFDYASRNPALRDGTGALIQRHIELCKKVLSVLAMASRTISSNFSEETWLVLLKVVMGTTDYLLKAPVSLDSTKQPPIPLGMGDQLCEHLLRVLFELWLRSKVTCNELWDTLKQCFSRWVHRPQVIQQWVATCLALTQRVIRLLYGSPEGTESINIVTSGLNVGLDLPNDFIFFAWHRIIYLVDDPCQLPNNFSLAILGISQLVDAFHAIGHNGSSGSVGGRKNKATVPDGNTILDMFGDWLFNACTMPCNENTREGIAEAYGCLCRIFSRPQHRQPFHREYLERFYSILIPGLRLDVALPTILTNTSDLFATELAGVRMLVPDFVVGLKHVLPRLAPKFQCSPRINLDDLHLAALRVCSTLISLPNHFSQVNLREEWNQGLTSTSNEDAEEIAITQIRVLYSEVSNTSRSFSQLKYHLIEMLLTSLKTETSASNLQFLLKLINVYVIEDIDFCPGLVGPVVKLVQEKILMMHWPNNVTLTAFDMLIAFVCLYDHVKEESKNCPRELVLSLCRYVDNLMSAGNFGQTYKLIIRAYECVIRWILIGQWIVDDNDCLQTVVSSLCRGITLYEREVASAQSEASSDRGKKPRNQPAFLPANKLFIRAQRNPPPESSSKPAASASTRYKKELLAIKSAAEICLARFANQLGKSPLLHEKWNDLEVARRICEKRQKEREKEAREMIHYFLLDDRIIVGLAETHHSETPEVVMVVRDILGRYSWRIQMQYFDYSTSSSIASTANASIAHFPSPLQPSLPSTSSSSMHDIPHLITKALAKVVAVNEDSIPDIWQILAVDKETTENRQPSQPKISFSEAKIMTEKQRLAEEERVAELKKNPQDIKYHAVPYFPPPDTNSPHAFRLFMSQMGFFSLENWKHVLPLPLTETLIGDLDALDSISERERMMIPIYFAISGDATLEDMLSEKMSLSEEFIQFVFSLGWPIDVAKHFGASSSAVAPYYADRDVEVIFRVPYLDDHFRKPYEAEHVSVIWVEDLRGYSQLVKQVGTDIGLVVNPLRGCAKNLYRIKVMTQRMEENQAFGPLMDGMIVSMHVLSMLIRITSISAHQHCADGPRPFEQRQKQILQILEKYKNRNMRVSEFYTHLFTNDK